MDKCDTFFEFVRVVALMIYIFFIYDIGVIKVPTLYGIYLQYEKTFLESFVDCPVSWDY